MTPFSFYLGSVLLIGLSVLLMRETAPYTMVGAREYEKRRIRRLAATIVGLIAAVAFLLGVTMQATQASP